MLRATLHDVAVVRALNASYATTAPFSPDESYPEYGLGALAPDGTNPVYEAVRRLFVRADLDAQRFGSAQWNPLAALIRPGETVVLKPNLVKEAHPRDPDGWQYVMTHGSVIRVVADYVFKAVGPSGRVIVADAPQTDSSFVEISRVLGLDTIEAFYRGRGLHLEVLDLRNEEWTSRGGVIVHRRPLVGDPRGGVAFDLADDSEFVGHRGEGRYYGADYDSEVVNYHHSSGRHEYLLSRTVMEADVVFSLPKLKTHKKAGVTSTLKNLVGVNADKNWLPHHTEGPRGSSGDESPDQSWRHRVERAGASRLRSLAVRVPGVGVRLLGVARRQGTLVFGDTDSVVRSGNWWGNDTVWRMCLDNKIVLYGKPDGSIGPDRPTMRRRHYSLVDGVLAGEGGGPLNPDPLPAGILMFGTNAAAVDAAATVLMGFDPDRVPIIRQAFLVKSYTLVDQPWREVHLRCDDVSEWNGPLGSIDHRHSLRARPHFSWTGHIEASASP